MNRKSNSKFIFTANAGGQKETTRGEMVRLTQPFPGTPELFKLAANVERSCSRLGIQWSDPDAPGRFHDAFKEWL